mgnify:CR=1 FL=1
MLSGTVQSTWTTISRFSGERRREASMTRYVYIRGDMLMARRGTISYRCVVGKILTREELLADGEEQVYVPPTEEIASLWRMGRWNSSWAELNVDQSISHFHTVQELQPM